MILPILFRKLRRIPTKEEILRCFVDEGCLLHGSRVDFNTSIKPGKNGFLCSTNSPAVALTKALFSNLGSGASLDYILATGRRAESLELKIFGLNEGTVGDSGFVYVIGDTKDALESPRGYNFERVFTTSKDYIAKIRISRSDFRYPVYYADTGRRIF